MGFKVTQFLHRVTNDPIHSTIVFKTARSTFEGSYSSLATHSAFLARGHIHISCDREVFTPHQCSSSPSLRRARIWRARLLPTGLCLMPWHPSTLVIAGFQFPTNTCWTSCSGVKFELLVPAGCVTIRSSMSLGAHLLHTVF